MSILIKGMEMPKNCSECWFYDDSRCYLFSYGVPNRYNYDALTMPDWCELIELPPHGRLIDADKAELEGWTLQKYICGDGSITVETGRSFFDLPIVIEAEESE